MGLGGKIMTKYDFIRKVIVRFRPNYNNNVEEFSNRELDIIIENVLNDYESIRNKYYSITNRADILRYKDYWSDDDELKQLQQFIKDITS